jgi:hypothetical protein
MFSIHDGRWVKVAAIACLGLAAGCQMYTAAPPPAPVSAAPIKQDPAMELRQWQLTRAEYTNDRVSAGATLQTFDTQPGPLLNNAAGDPLIFVANTLLMPFGIFVPQNWGAVDYKSMHMEDTYTGNEPLPQTPAPPY